MGIERRQEGCAGEEAAAVGGGELGGGEHLEPLRADNRRETCRAGGTRLCGRTSPMEAAAWQPENGAWWEKSWLAERVGLWPGFVAEGGGRGPRNG